jgi:hypothetical protein
MTRSGLSWSLCHYVCVRSAVERIRPEKVFFYYEYEPTGPWWKLTKPLVTPVRIKAPRQIFDKPLVHFAHRADVVRLEKLIEHGGIYLDCDVFVHRSFDDLLGHSAVLGEECAGATRGLCNAVILAEAGAPFLRRWYAEYSTFRSKGHDAYWNEHSVHVPLKLAKLFPDELCVLSNRAFFWPSWTRADLNRMFASLEPLDAPDAYANHLWESRAWRPFLEGLTPGAVRATDSHFHAWARPMVADLDDNFGSPSMPSVYRRRLLSALRSAASAVPKRFRNR